MSSARQGPGLPVAEQTINRAEVLLMVPPDDRGADAPDEALGVQYLAAAVRHHGLGVQIMLANVIGLGVRTAAEVAVLARPEVIGVSLFQRQLVMARQTLELIRRGLPDAHICLGGHLPSLVPAETLEALPQADSVIVGEGELVFPELCSRVVSSRSWQELPGLAWQEPEGLGRAGSPRPINDLDSLVAPDRSVLPDVVVRGGAASLVSSRGCYGACSFCSINAFHALSRVSPWRGRSPARVIEELEELAGHGYSGAVKLQDDNVFGAGARGRARVLEMAESLRAADLPMTFSIQCRPDDLDAASLAALVDAGVDEMVLGVETIGQTFLTASRKRIEVDRTRQVIELIKAQGLGIRLGFMMFNPYSTMASIRQDLDFLCSVYCEQMAPNVINTATMSIMKAYHGTVVADQLQQSGRLVARGPLEGYHGYRLDDTQVSRLYNVLFTLYDRWVGPLIWRVSAPGVAADQARTARIHAIERAWLESFDEVLEVFEAGADRTALQRVVEIAGARFHDLGADIPGLALRETGPEQRLGSVFLFHDGDRLFGADPISQVVSRLSPGAWSILRQAKGIVDLIPDLGAEPRAADHEVVRALLEQPAVPPTSITTGDDSLASVPEVVDLVCRWAAR